MLEMLKESLKDCPVVMLGDYSYFIHPLTDGIPSVDPALLNEVARSIVNVGDFDCDIIVVPEAMGILVGTAVSGIVGLPLNVIRKRKYDLPGEIDVAQHTGYSKSDMFINGIHRGDRVVVLDDVLSTGGTLCAILDALKNRIGADIIDVVVIFDKSGKKSEIAAEFNVTVKALLYVGIVDGKVLHEQRL